MAARVYDVSILLKDGSTTTVQGHGNTKKTASRQALLSYRREHGEDSAQCVMRTRFRPTFAPGYRG